MSTNKEKNLNEELFKNRLVFWDTETTGLRTEEGDKMIQFAGVEVINGEITSYYSTLIKPVIEVQNGKEIIKPINDRAFEIHHISDNDLLKSPTFKDVSNDIINFMKDSIAIAHNDSFDIGFLNSELQNINSDFTFSKITKDHLDTLYLSRCFDAKDKSHKLDSIVSRYNNANFYSKIKIKKFGTENDYLEVDLSERLTRHDALVDCALLAKVCLFVLKNKWDLSLLKDFDKKLNTSFAPLTLPDNYTPVFTTITDEEQKNNIVYLQTLENEITKTKQKKDPTAEAFVSRGTKILLEENRFPQNQQQKSNIFSRNKI